MKAKFKNKIYTVLKDSLIIFFSSIFIISSTTAADTSKSITYMQILQKPNDLDLNLKYAQQQGKK